MKYSTIILITILSAFMIHCASPQKVMYELPAEMSEAIRSDYVKQCEKGQILYNINCAGCHTTKVKGKEIIPDFTSAQLVGYGLRVTNARHETNITEESVSTEELGLIMTFLSYKKKNPVGTVAPMPKL
jgi:mono/diheme cytochrome c family protein